MCFISLFNRKEMNILISEQSVAPCLNVSEGQNDTNIQYDDKGNLLSP
jgi:hypothetical protein